MCVCASVCIRENERETEREKEFIDGRTCLLGIFASGGVCVRVCACMYIWMGCPVL